jgi:hypothetical protein
MPQGYKIREYDGIDKSLSRQQTLKRFKVWTRISNTIRTF